MKKLDLLEGNAYITVSTAKLYQGFIGEEKWVIVTNLKEDELCAQYSLEVEKLRPWILITVEQYAAMVDWKRNEEKHRKRAYGHEIYYGVDSNYAEKLISENKEKRNAVYDQYEQDNNLICCLKILTPVQRKRFYRYSVEGYSIRAIAEEEGCSFASIKECINSSRKKLRNYYIQEANCGGING